MTLRDIVNQGGFPSSFVFHICGMPWACTNDPRLKSFLDAGSADALTLRQKMFGYYADSVATPDILTILDNNLGTQTINYGDDKSLEISGWSVRLFADNPSGASFDGAGSFDCRGIVGLTFQPEFTTPGSVRSVLYADIAPDTTSPTACTLSWPANKDFGLYTWLDGLWGGAAYTVNPVLWCGSSCLLPYEEATLDDTGPEHFYSVACHCQIYNAPNEYIAARRNEQNIFVTNYPQGIDGLTANLWAVQLNADGTLNSGTTPFLLRTGKVKPGTTINGGLCTVSVGGFTDQLKISQRIEQFEGHLTGYYFNTYDQDGPNNNGAEYGGVEHNAHIVVCEMNATTGALTIDEIDLCAADSTVSFDTVDEVIDATVTAINASATLNCTYQRVGDDIHNTTAGYQVIFGGMVPWVAGLGYIQQDYFGRLTARLMAGNIKPQPQRPIADYYARVLSVGASYLLTSQTGMHVVVEYGTGTNASNFNSASSGYPGIRNKSRAAYFVQGEWTDIDSVQQAWGLQPVEWPAYAASRNVYYTSTDQSWINAGSIVSLGTNRYELSDGPPTATVTSTGSGYFAASAGFTPLPMYMIWCAGIYDALTYDEQYFADAEQTISTFANPAQLNMTASGGQTGPARTGEPTSVQELLSASYIGDPYMIMDNVSIRALSPVTIIKSILGDPNAGTMISGVPKSLQVSDIRNVCNRGEYYNPVLIDFARLSSIVSSAGLDGVIYKMLISDESREQKIDVMSLLLGICHTHNCKMAYDYNESLRSWWITFNEYGEDTEAVALNYNRTIDDADKDAGAQPQEIKGGQWLFSDIKAEYNTVDGGTVTYNVKGRDSRTRHSLHGKTLEISDDMTTLPVDSTAASDKLIQTLSEYQQRFSRVQNKFRLRCKVAKAASVSVGKVALVDCTSIRDVQTGKFGNGAIGCDVVGMEIGLGDDTSCTVEFLTKTVRQLGIAPAIYLDSPSQAGAVLTCSTAIVAPADNNFGDPSDAVLTDLAYFDCYDNVDGVLTARNCSCGNYRVTVFERTKSALYFDDAYTYANQNVWRGTISGINVGTGAYTITLDDDNNFSTVLAANPHFVVKFADRADANLQPCQLRSGWYGDGEGLVVDSSANTEPAIMVG